MEADSNSEGAWPPSLLSLIANQSGEVCCQMPERRMRRMELQRNERHEPTGFILNLPQRYHMFHAFTVGFHVTVEHRAVGGQSRRVDLPCDLQPASAVGLVVADLVADPLGEHAEVRLPVLVVSRNQLGTLNHTLLTTFSARAMDLALSGFIINRMPREPDSIEAAAPHLLSSLASADLLGVLPEVAGSCDEEKVVQLAKEIDQLPAYQWLLSVLGLQL